MSTELFINREEFEKIRRKFGAPIAGDLLLTSVGTLGSPYVVRKSEEFYFKDGNLTWFRNFKNLYSHYLYYWLQSPQGKAELQKCTIGSSQSAYTIVLLKGMDIVLPPLETQRKIAAILSSYDDLIENNSRRIQILEEMARGLYREWFVNFRFPGFEDVEMVDSSLGRIPVGWKIQTVAQTIEIIGGGTPSRAVEEYWSEGDVNWYTPSDLTSAKAVFMNSSSEKITRLGLAKSSARMFPPNCVMMTSRATIGVVAINTSDATTNQGFIIMKPNDLLPLYTLYFWVKENVPQFINKATGTIFKEISRGTFKAIEFVLPPVNLTQAFEVSIQFTCGQIHNLSRKNQNLRRTRDILLPKLISGEVDVSQLEVAGVIVP